MPNRVSLFRMTRRRRSGSNTTTSLFTSSISLMTTFSVSLLTLFFYYQADFDAPPGVSGRKLVKGVGGGTILQVSKVDGNPPLLLKELRGFCDKYAPTLKDASWRNANGINSSSSYPLGDFSFFAVPRPVCFRNKKVYYDDDALQPHQRPEQEKTYLHLSWNKLSDHSLMRLWEGHSVERVTVVPAIGIVPIGRFMLGQLYHSMQDVVEPVMSLMLTAKGQSGSYSFSEFGDTPTQFFTLPASRLVWTRSDIRTATSQTAKLMNVFSYPKAPARYFFDTAPVLNKNLVYCSCQAMFVGLVRYNAMKMKNLPLILASDLMLRYMNDTPYETKLDAVKTTNEKRGGVHPFIIRRFERVPHIAKHFWKSEVEMMTQCRGGKCAEANMIYKPRLVFITRSKRRVHNSSFMIAEAEKIGFNVQVVDMGSLELDEQYHVTRHADVLMGIHGMALTHVLWMDGRLRSYCRTLIELMPYGCPSKHLHYVHLSASAYIYHEKVKAVDMYFDDTADNLGVLEKHEKDLENVKVKMRSCNYNWKSPEFSEQIAMHDMTKVTKALRRSYERWVTCSVM